MHFFAYALGKITVIYQINIDRQDCTNSKMRVKDTPFLA